MKYLLLVPVAIICCIAAKAQKFELSKNPVEEFKRKKLLAEKLKNLSPTTKQTFSNNQEQEEDPGVIKMPIKGQYLGVNEKGDRIFVMSPDNMPCLVPGPRFQSNMPIAGNDKAGGFSNPVASQKVEIIPLRDDNNASENSKNR